MYENLQRFSLRLFELTFLELIFLGIPVSVWTIIASVSGLNPHPGPIMLVVFIGGAWGASYGLMWMLRPVWTIPIGDPKPSLAVKYMPR